MANYDFFQNKDCEFFPCHQGANPETFNCLFCYCPLYALGDQCGGNFSYTAGGIKDCSACLRPHRPSSFQDISREMDKVIALCRKDTGYT